ncbi:hypothetical protein BGZ70_004896 [Mortierella alpina]|uniref:Uncharacterized protein n=1 Tax=Mortierella alpina TaxID=64518 RepID=A0A9P6M4P2_MORAP|nr:hypothetical protein BGZ70_004896 [Mortierella alpina]
MYPASLTLASIILETGMRVFRHIDRSQERRERSDSYTLWNKKTLDLTKHLQEFAGEQVQQSADLRARAGDLTIGICNMLIRYAEMARSEYVYLNLAFKFIVMLAPNCLNNRSARLERPAAVRLLSESILGTLLDIFHVCSESADVGEKFLKRHWILAQFYSRFIMSEAIKKNHPAVQLEMLKFVGTVEDIVVPVLLAAQASPDMDVFAVLQEFSTSSGPRAVFPIMEYLTDNEWNLGRLYFLLKTLSLFDEFTPSLQLQLYPLEKSSWRGSLLSRVVDCVSAMDLYEVMSLKSQEGEQDSSDLYVRILSELCTFVHLVQPKQFARLQVDMMGLVLGRSEILSILATDWWSCMADSLGQEFTRKQVNVLTALISCTVEYIVAFLSSMQPLQGPELIQVLNTFQSWEDLPERKRPLSKFSMSLFLRSCSAVRITEDSQMIKLKALLSGFYSDLLEDKEWIVAHESLQSLLSLLEHASCRDLASACVPAKFQKIVQVMQDLGDDSRSTALDDARPFWGGFSSRVKQLESSTFSVSSVGDLQSGLKAEPSPQACIASLSTATRMLRAMGGTVAEDVAFRNRLKLELAELKKLLQ